MSRRTLQTVLALAVLGFGAAWASRHVEAQESKVAPARHLYGSWHGAGGDWTLQLGTDKSAIMEAGLTTNGGKAVDWRRGTFAFNHGAWTLRVRDIDRREYVYAIVSVGPDEMNLIDTSGKYTRFFRTHETTLKAIAGRWTGPGSDYNLITNNDRSASLEIGIAKGFGPFSEVRTGNMDVHDGYWTLTVRRVDATKNEPGPTQSYAIISHTPYQLSLVDAKGNVLKFHRLGEPFEALVPGLSQGQ